MQTRADGGARGAARVSRPSVVRRAAVGGHPNSGHLQGLAADIAADGQLMYEILRWAPRRGFTGIGVARWGVHLDLLQGPLRPPRDQEPADSRSTTALTNASAPSWRPICSCCAGPATNCSTPAASGLDDFRFIFGMICAWGSSLRCRINFGWKKFAPGNHRRPPAPAQPGSRAGGLGQGAAQLRRDR